MSIRAVHHLNCATMCPVAGFLLGMRGWRGRMVAHCLLLETAQDGLVLVDTGFGTAEVRGERKVPRMFGALVSPAMDPGEPAIAQVEQLGYKPADVRHIVVTHLDLDHAGGLSDFPDAQVHLHAREHAAAMSRATGKERERYQSAQWAHDPKWQVYEEQGDTWRGLPAIATLRGIREDIGIVPMHGHTRGHSAVIAKSGDRWLVHAGDAYFARASVTGGKAPFGLGMFERAMQMDGAARRASVGALAQLRKSYEDVELFCAHDAAEYDSVTA